MATTLDQLKNPLNPVIVFVKIHYLNNLGEADYFLFSDKFKKFSNGDVPEVRLDNIPFFKKEIDPLNNAVIVASGYKISIANQDDVLSELLKDKIFNNQKVEFYVSTEDSSDEVLVATALINDAVISDKIELNLKEVNDLTKKNKLNGFTIYSQDHTARLTQYLNEKTNNLEIDTHNTELEKKGKQVVLGKVNKAPVINVNPVDTKNWVGTRCWGSIYIIPGETYSIPTLFFLNDASDNTRETRHTAQLQKIRKALFNGDKLTIAGSEKKFTFKLASSYYTEDDTYTNSPQGIKYQAPLTEKYLNLELDEGDIEDFYGITLEGEILIQVGDALNYNDEFLVSDNHTSTYEETNLVSAKTFESKNILKAYAPATNDSLNAVHKIINYGSVGSQNFIEIEDNWTFLEQGDLINVCYLYDGTLRLSEEFEVNSYDPITKKIWFKEPNALSYPMLLAIFEREEYPSDPHEIKVRFDKIQKITVKGKEITRKKNYFDLKVGNSSTTFAGPLDFYPFQNDLYSGNEIKFIESSSDFLLKSGLRMYVKKNAHQIIANLGQVFISKLNTNLNFNNGDTIMSYGVSDYSDYVSGANARIEYNFRQYGDFKQNYTQEQLSRNFWHLKIRYGTCTVAQLKALADDPNCPFYWTYTGSDSDTIDVPTLTSLTGHTTTKLKVSSTDYAKFYVANVIRILQSGNETNVHIKAKSISGSDYFLEFSALGFTPSDSVQYKYVGEGSTMAANIELETSRAFRIPGFISIDTNNPYSTTAYSNSNTSSRDKYETSNTAGAEFYLEKDSDVLIRKQNLKQKLVLTWFLEHNGTAHGNSSWDYLSEGTYKTKTVSQYIGDASESFRSLVKTNWDDTNVMLNRAAYKYTTTINLCPNFNLNSTVYRWGGAGETTDFGYISGVSNFEKRQAMAMAIACKFNLNAYHNLALDGGVGIVAVAITDGTDWWVRFKHMTYNNATGFNDRYWKNSTTDLTPSQASKNYSVFIPFIRNGSLYIKLDRKALTQAIGVASNDSFKNLTNSPDLQYLDDVSSMNDYYDGSYSRAYREGNGVNSWWEDILPTAYEKNPSVLVKKHSGRNFLNVLNFVIPNRISAKIGVNEYEKQFSLEKFDIIETTSAIFPNLSHAIVEKWHNNYVFNRASPGDETKTNAENEELVMSCENFYQMTNWDDLNFQPAYAKRNLFYDKNNNNRFYKYVELDSSADITVYFKDKNSDLGNCLKKVMEVYGITNYNQASLDTLTDSGVFGFLVIDKEQEFYKNINPLLEANNVVCFTNEDGELEFKKLDLLSETAVKTINYYDTASLVKKIECPQFTKVILNYGKDSDGNDLTQEIINDAKDTIFNDNNLDNPKILNVNLIGELTNENDKFMLIQKYTEQNKFIEFEVSMEYINLNLNDIIKFIFKDNTEGYYLITKKETDFSGIKFKAIKCVVIPE